MVSTRSTMEVGIEFRSTCKPGDWLVNRLGVLDDTNRRPLTSVQCSLGTQTKKVYEVLTNRISTLAGTVRGTNTRATTR